MSLYSSEQECGGVISQVKRIAEEFEVSRDNIGEATRYFVKQLNDGLKRDGAPMCQIPSYVTNLPNGTETGVCLAVDLGGTNLRVCSVRLHGDSTYSLTQSKTAIPRNLMTGTSYKDLFRFIAVQVRAFMEKDHQEDLDAWSRIAKDTPLTKEYRLRHFRRLGFTFSFTFDQHALDEGTVLYWTKSFDIPDAIGRDPCAMLQEAMDELNLPLVVTALTNDTVGTLVARSYTAPGTSGTLAGAIFGTGTNGAYVERMANIAKLLNRPEFASYKPDDMMILNTEWGGFDDKLVAVPSTIYDASLDRESVNPGEQLFEKQISGMYLGELLRRILLLLLAQKPPALDMKVPPESILFVSDSIDSSLLSFVASDASPGLDIAKEVISRILGVINVSVQDAMAVRILSIAIGRRAARLSAIAIAGILIQSGRLQPVSNVKASSKPHDEDTIPAEEVIDIGVDGSLFELFPNFEEYLRLALRDIPEIGRHGERRVRIGLAKDGSGVGAALIAWSAER
ncbi:hexokinase [Rhizodiscina lignyota]|uniref:Phosphotransferase n=1 Tax=Rhizodiscina lignyota TaxID=1504668 RepID=A0A9P4IBX1_9PEZI|nr:hexokinase [Rhizodiscina lignyota]